MTRRRFFLATLAVPGAFGLTGCEAMRKVIARPTPAPVPNASASPAQSAEADALALPFDKTVFLPMNGLCLGARIPVIMYHDIVKKRGKGSVWFDITVAEFREQMEWMRDQGATPITLEALHQHLTRGEAVPDKAVVLTFDDNYQGFYDLAYPVLHEMAFPSAMFVHTNFVGDKTGSHTRKWIGKRFKNWTPEAP